MPPLPPVPPIWHPFTQHALFPTMTRITGASGGYLMRENGVPLMDCIASWWVVTHGHCHPRIVAAIQHQATVLDQVIFAGYTHPPAEELAAALLALTPAGLDTVFFSDSGSTAVEVALKMALGFWYHQGEKRQRIVVLENSYHGDTIGTMSIGERGVFNQPYAPLMFSVDTIPFPSPNRVDACLTRLRDLCRQGDVAAFIVEPLIQGAGGMMIYSPATLRAMYEICTAHDVVFIADEVMTGWGRTGTLFACSQADISPDIACISKGLTGGHLPLAVTLCGPAFFAAHFSEDRRKTFFHSSSYTANPIACAAALANIKIWQEEPVMDRIQNIIQWQKHGLARIKALDRFDNVRQIGTIVAFDIRGTTQGYLSDIAPKLYGVFEDRGLLLRPLGQTLYIMPPYCLDAQDFDKIYTEIEQVARDML